jgi:hypothetical protein
MARSWLARRLGICLVLTLFALLPAGIAYAQATVFRFEFQEPLTGSTALPECLPPDLVGTQTGTETTVGQVTETERGFFQVHGTTTLEYQVVFPDGRYVVGTAVEHFSFIANGPQTISTTTIQEPRTIYSADGQPIGKVFIHALSHVTFRDANGNSVPDPGEITANVDRFFFTCH